MKTRLHNGSTLDRKSEFAAAVLSAVDVRRQTSGSSDHLLIFIISVHYEEKSTLLHVQPLNLNALSSTPLIIKYISEANHNGTSCRTCRKMLLLFRNSCHVLFVCNLIKDWRFSNICIDITS